jgi:hypothetical protein
VFVAFNPWLAIDGSWSALVDAGEILWRNSSRCAAGLSAWLKRNEVLSDGVVGRLKFHTVNEIGPLMLPSLLVTV